MLKVSRSVAEKSESDQSAHIGVQAQDMRR
jgi:hypothetical protein